MMKNYLIFIIAILLAVMVYPITANAQKLMGVVVEKNTNGVDEPLAGANIVWMGSTTGTTSGSNGRLVRPLILGVENLNNFTLDNPIVASDLPFSQYFDTSMVWGPIFGRMFYAGFRFRIK